MTRCFNRNKKKFNCGTKVSSDCTSYEGWLPDWSDLKGEDCVSVAEVLEEQYQLLDKILHSIDVSDLGRSCVDYPVSDRSKLTVAMVLTALESRFCSLGNSRTVVYSNDEMSRSAKANAGAGYEGEEVTYTVRAGMHVSGISKEDANNLALADLDKNTQDYANKNGSVTPIVYYNEERSVSFVRNDCPGGEPCGDVVYTVPAGKYTSTISVQQANILADGEIQREGQKNANLYGKCKVVYYNQAISKLFFKSDCEEGKADEDGYLFEVQTGAFKSTVSQFDADTKAKEHLEEFGQKYADLYGTCKTYYLNDKVSDYFERKDCGEGYTGKSKIYNIEAGKVRSFLSKDDANTMAKKLLYDKGSELIRLEGECVPKYWGIKAVAVPSGTATIKVDAKAQDGEYIMFDVEPIEDFAIDYVTVNGVQVQLANGTRGSFKVKKDSTIKVYTKADNTFDISVSSSPEEGGFVMIKSDKTEFDAGENCIIEAEPADGYLYYGWYHNGVQVSQSLVYAFVVGRQTAGEYIAVFRKEDE